MECKEVCTFGRSEQPVKEKQITFHMKVIIFLSEDNIEDNI